MLVNSPGSSLISVVDVETTGLSPWGNDRIVEIAVVLMSPDGTIHEEYETLVNPDRDIGPSRIHHITAAEILHAPRFSDIAGDVAALLSKAHVLAGHNVSFDKNFLITEYQRIGIAIPDPPLLCTCQLLGRNSLAACCKEFGLVIEGAPHRALSDARATASLIQRLITDDPAILHRFPLTTSNWPYLSPKKTAPVSRDYALRKLQEPPKFLQRIRARVHHDTDTTTPNVIAYLALVDRILEDRSINENEENTLVEAVTNLQLSMQQVKEAHQAYIHSLVVHALADGIVSDAERSDLHRVARLLGHDQQALDQILQGAAAHLQATNTAKTANFTNNQLRGKRVCFTGELQSRVNGELITREVAEMLAEQAGLVVASSVTKKLDLLVVADPNTQSGKARKAREYGTRILADSVFWRMIGVNVS